MTASSSDSKAAGEIRVTSFEKDLLRNQSSNVDVDVGNVENKETLTYDKPWYRVPHFLKLNILLLMPALAGSINGFDAFLVNSLQIMENWKEYMGNPTGGTLGALTAGPPIGYLAALWIAKVVSDKHGRKPAMVIGAIITTIGTIIQTFSNGYACFLVSRIIVGFGSAFYYVAAPAWLAELAFPEHRSVMVILFNSSAYVGGLVATWVSYGTMGLSSTWQWRAPCLSQLVFTIPHLMFIWFLPESPRFLVSKGMIEKARNILLRYHGGDDSEKAGTFIDFELREIELGIEKDREGDKTSFKAFFQTKGNFHRFMICMFMGFLQYNVGLFAVTYYLNPLLTAAGMSSDRQQMLVAGGITIFNVFAAYFSSLVVGRFGRRKLFLWNLVGLFISYFAFVVLSGINTETSFQNPALAKGILAVIFFTYLFYDIGFLGMLLVYITEITPFALRSGGVMIYMLSANCWVIFNSFVTPVAMDSIGWRFYIVYACTIVFCFIFIYFFFPETKGYYLEEVALIFDGEAEGKPANLEQIRSYAEVVDA
ncbi:hypothetical protein DASC09_008780 [Saccharomycopsis crataegensis]|uniref:Major facilitator superfamily (MFS) profile domain-containing protein n=1 Tax=Saccharomycopsis crataegensis TaxID=43959 RepID=A0AAV5QHB4_9ASCO|nr:hypothetical protein DASC09_008780 [Saccharomycopsis crataegensis]